MANRGRKRGRPPGGRKTGGRKRGSLNKLTIKMGGTFTETAQQFDARALAVLVTVMEDEAASPSARVRAAEWRDPDFVPLAERLKEYARRDAVDAAEAKGKSCKSCRRRNEHYRPRPTCLVSL
jgi:hypothetical protein